MSSLPQHAVTIMSHPSVGVKCGVARRGQRVGAGFPAGRISPPHKSYSIGERAALSSQP